MRPALAAAAVICLVLTTSACGGGDDEGRADPASPTSTSPGATKAAEGSPGDHDNTVEVSRVTVAPAVTRAFSQADVANAAAFVERWVTDLAMRPEDILASRLGYTEADFAHLRPYVTDDFWDDLAGMLPGARRTARTVAADKEGASYDDDDVEDFHSLKAIGGYGINTPGGALESAGLISPEVRDIRIVANPAHATTLQATFTASWYLRFDLDDPEVARSLTEVGSDVPEGADALHLENDRTIWITRAVPGDPWRAYAWWTESSTQDYVVLADALGS